MAFPELSPAWAPLTPSPGSCLVSRVVRRCCPGWSCLGWCQVDSRHSSPGCCWCWCGRTGLWAQHRSFSLRQEAAHWALSCPMVGAEKTPDPCQDVRSEAALAWVMPYQVGKWGDNLSWHGGTFHLWHLVLDITIQLDEIIFILVFELFFCGKNIFNRPDQLMISYLHFSSR